MPRLRLDVNGAIREIDIPPGSTLLEALRDRLGLTGAKEGCGRGECGACTVLHGSKPVLACLMLAEATSEAVTTIEGLATEFADLRQAFADFGAFQCGYCTPGQIVRAAALLAEEWPTDKAEIDAFIRRRISGNICRCTGYTGIVDAIAHVHALRAGTKEFL
jgi:aerobic-type carbon monoxide dehydrogenase small subunit (CoxS/CutS family)